MDDTRSKQFDFATDLVKQLITLATGVLAVTITFLHDVLGNAPASTSLKVSWALYLVSIPFGILTMMGLTGELTNDNPSILSGFITIPGMLQVATFVGATVSLLVFGWNTYT
jgi:hypothetical protein